MSKKIGTAVHFPKSVVEGNDPISHDKVFDFIDSPRERMIIREIMLNEREGFHRVRMYVDIRNSHIPTKLESFENG